jgi:hypothetical protein
MAITIGHSKTISVADWTQAYLDSLIAAGYFPAGTVLADIWLPSDWNADHTISLSSGTLLGNSTGVAGSEEITIGSGLMLSGGVLSGSAGYTDEQAQDAVFNAIADSATIDVTYNDASNSFSLAVIQSAIDHGSIGGLSDDDHTQYALLAGRAGGQTLTGGTAASNNLVVRSTSHGTKGQVYFDETTASTTTATGAVRIGGGLGVGGRGNFGSTVTSTGLLATTNQANNIGSSSVRFNAVNAAVPKFFNNLLTTGSMTLTSTSPDSYFIQASGDVAGTSVLEVDVTGGGFTSTQVYIDSLGSSNNQVYATNNIVGGIFIGGVSCYAGNSSTGNVVSSTIGGAGGGILIGANYAHGGDGTTPSTSTFNSGGFASLVAGACGSSLLTSGNGAATTLQNTSEGGASIGSVQVADSTTGHVATMEGTGTAAAYTFGKVGRGILRASNRSTVAIGAIDCTSNTAGAFAAGLGSMIVARCAGTGSATVSGNASFGVINVTAAGSGSATISGAGSAAIAQLSSSGNLTVSSAGSAFIGRLASTGSVSITTGAGNFGIGDAGTTGISATGSVNCGQIGQGANTIASSVRFGEAIRLLELTSASGASNGDISSDGTTVKIYSNGIDRNIQRFVQTLTVDTTAVGNITTGEDDLMSYTIPANTLTVNGDFIEQELAGDFAATVNAKTVKIKYGATTLFSTGAIAVNTGKWHAWVKIVRTSATTQIATVEFTTNNALLVASTDLTTPAETLSGTVVLKATGEGTATNDVRQLLSTVTIGRNS